MEDGTAVEIENISEMPERSYEMNPVPVLALLETGKVVGTWHTHPDEDPNLSEEDRVGFLGWPALKHYIIGFREGVVTEQVYYVEDGVVLACD